MAMELWRPLREMRWLADEMERMMGETSPSERRVWGWLPGLRARMFPVNMYKKNNDFIIEASLPDIKPEDVDVRMSGNTLTIRAERKETKETKEEDYYCREMWAGHFFREMTLPSEVQSEKAEATYENGILRLRLPVKEAVRESHLKVKVAGGK